MEHSESRLPAGLRTRDLRRRRGLTLDQLASRAGLSTGHLSRFERGEKSLSLAALLRLAEALETSVGILLGEEMDAGDIKLVRAGQKPAQRVTEGDSAYDFCTLGGRESGHGSHGTFLVSLPRSGRRTSAAFHGGHELLYLLSGRLRVKVGNREVDLEAGDYMEFPGHYRHEIESLDETSRILIVVLDGN